MRKMATIRKINSISPIEGADAIEVAEVDGWQVVIKKNEYTVGDLVVYCEIDSWIPTSLAPFLSKGKEPKVYNQVQGERLKTVKLKGQISQGLILPLTVLADNTKIAELVKEGEDVTAELCIQKWEAPVNPQLTGQVEGNFPSAIPKTDQERIQNIKLETYYGVYEVTEKLEGSSMTCYLDVQGNFEVCSRNLSLKEDANNSFWKAALQENIKQKMLDNNLQGFAIQGELIGEGIQGNIYKLKGVSFYVFDIYDTLEGSYLESEDRLFMCDKLELNHAPVLSNIQVDESTTKDQLLDVAEGASSLHNTEREGVVLKCTTNTNKHFKCISNKYLLK